MRQSFAEVAIAHGCQRIIILLLSWGQYPSEVIDEWHPSMTPSQVEKARQQSMTCLGRVRIPSRRHRHHAAEFEFEFISLEGGNPLGRYRACGLHGLGPIHGIKEEETEGGAAIVLIVRSSHACPQCEKTRSTRINNLSSSFVSVVTCCERRAAQRNLRERDGAKAVGS